MKNKFRILTTLIIVAGAGAAVYLVTEPTIKQWKANKQANEEATREQQYEENLLRINAANIASDPSGDRLMMMAIARLEQTESIAAKLLHEAHLGGMRIVGNGKYLQQGSGDRRQLWWLLETQHDGVRASLLQCMKDGHLWIDRVAASGRTIERIDLWELRRHQKQQSPKVPASGANSIPLSNQLTTSIGGLPKLLESLRANFEFSKPGVFRAPENLNLGDQPVIGLIGRWRTESVVNVLVDFSDVEDDDLTGELLTQRLHKRLESAPLPEWMPMNVMILLGQDDLFPYLIEYRARDDSLASIEVEQASLFQLSNEPLARLTMQGVEFNREISTVDFIYEAPREPDWDDGTTGYERRLERAEAIRVAQREAGRLASSPGDAPH
ncbi:hypothetical protein [Aeoliella mucimassa]|uniref:Uncharacterized protein n=1 Tax=Aeoliella mucimassa TaxID=2527972 RepID=A0A518AMD8_9BACT|nr:hypothetical protein [Aeoliella mucimassa]QDU55873.1 hypothetical protein Pan181_20700 [Aeoliella mucimassa]